MYTLLSLFDKTGQWAAPFADKGWEVIQWDLQISSYHDINNIIDVEFALNEFENVDGIIAAVPCTDYTSAGAQYWLKKDSEGYTAASIELVRQVQRLADLFTPTDPEYDEPFFWCMENPVGRIGKLFPELGIPFYFHPWEFAGHLGDLSKKDIAELDAIRLKNGHGITKAEADHILWCNAYTKKTGLWGDFNRELVKIPIENVKGSPQGSVMQRFGGKSEKTKNARSATPEGFAIAFADANEDWKGYKEEFLTVEEKKQQAKDLAKAKLLQLLKYRKAI